jgi:AcrR family transcriptional regulator
VARGRGRDHDAIRQAIVDAAGTAVEQGGVESLTFRRVAAAAGVSPGRVQHYFTDRASLVQACFDTVQDRARSRVEATLAAVEPSPAEVVAAILRTMIPRSPEDFRDLRVVTMFETMALTEPALGRALLEGHAELRRLLIDQVALVLRGPGSELEAAGTTSPETLSDGLLATAGGLAIEVLHGHLGSDEANRVLDAALACGLGKNTANGTEAGHDT